MPVGPASARGEAPFPGNAGFPGDAGAKKDIYGRGDDDDGDGDAAGAPGPGGNADASKLAGVPGVASLPAPGPIKPAVAKDFGREISVFGEYVMMCFHSTPWVLREAALQKIELDLESYSVSKVGARFFEVNGWRGTGVCTWGGGVE